MQSFLSHHSTKIGVNFRTKPYPRDSEIGNLCDRFVAENQNIFRLQVSVNDLLRVQVLEATTHSLRYGHLKPFQQLLWSSLIKEFKIATPIMGQLHGFVCAFHPSAEGLIPEYAIYAIFHYLIDTCHSCTEIKERP